MNWIAQISGSAQAECKEINIPERTETDACKPCKPVETDLKPCSICHGLDFIHGENGGYFCATCQPGHEGQQVRAGASRPETNTVFPVPEAKPAKGQQPRQHSLPDQPPSEQDPGRYDYAGGPF